MCGARVREQVKHGKQLEGPGENCGAKAAGGNEWKEVRQN